jgi:hypothetical protein
MKNKKPEGKRRRHGVEVELIFHGYLLFWYAYNTAQ